MIYVFDGSLEGLLCAVFEWFERKPGRVQLQLVSHYQPDAFTSPFYVLNDRKKADRVWKALEAKLQKDSFRKFYCTYLSELPEAFTALFEYACYVFSNEETVEHNFGNTHVLTLAQTARKVEREKHRMEAFIRFKHAADGIFYCAIEPDFNVLPLIARHFKDRYADQEWIIYDVRRNYGLYYDLRQVAEISMDDPAVRMMKAAVQSPEILDGKEALYDMLWKDYFKSTNIQARKNTKLHVRHVPKRYWRYLTEKL